MTSFEQAIGTFIAALVVLAISLVAMGVGRLMGRGALRGSCRGQCRRDPDGCVKRCTRLQDVRDGDDLTRIRRR